MKRIALFALLAFTGCTTETEYGDCKGWMNADEKRPDRTYEVDVGNVVGAVFLAETVAGPILITGLVLWCPTGPAVPVSSVRQ